MSARREANEKKRKLEIEGERRRQRKKEKVTDCESECIGDAIADKGIHKIPTRKPNFTID